MTVAQVTPKSRGKKKDFDNPAELGKNLKENPAAKILDIKRKQLEGVHNQVADDFVYYRDEPVDALSRAFPYDKSMQYCDRYYPHAPQGPIYIDSPQTRPEQDKCEQKAHVMLEAKKRYCYVLPGEFLEDVLKRLPRELGLTNRNS